MKVRIEKPQSSIQTLPIVLVVSLVILVVAGVFLVPFFFAKPSLPLAFEVTSLEGDVQISNFSSRGWHVPNRGEEFREGQRIRTGTDGVVSFRVENQILLRLKENGEILNKECRYQEEKDIYRLRLVRGALLGTTTKEFDRKVEERKALFVVSTPRYTSTPRGAIFRMQTADGLEEGKVGVLRGSVEMVPTSFLVRKQGVLVRGLERAVVVDGEAQAAKRVSNEEWREMKEAYELLEKSAAMEAEQIDLSKAAGNFFKDVVFDHGTFFTPKVGYSGREFFMDLDTKEVLLENEYDVFPEGSFVGVYFKTRDFDASKYEGLEFEARRRGEEGYPDVFFIELKSKGNVVRRFLARGFHHKWTSINFPFHVRKETPITEIVFVFTNERVGVMKKGILEFRNFNLIPKVEDQLVPLAPVRKIVQQASAHELGMPVISAPPSMQASDSRTIIASPVISQPSRFQEAEDEQRDSDELVAKPFSLR